MSMFQNRRTVFLFVCSIVLIQALYYIATLQIKKTPAATITFVQRSNIEQNATQSTNVSILAVQPLNTSTVSRRIKTS